jgi:hypothetical protein
VTAFGEKLFEEGITPPASATRGKKVGPIAIVAYQGLPPEDADFDLQAD